ncbi:MAG: nucleotide exchange factor GrpE [Phycisphaerales bacterium JB065]
MNEQNNPTNDKQSKKRAKELRDRLNQLASEQQSAMSEMDQIQQELSEIDGESSEETAMPDPAEALRADLAAAESNYQRALADLQNYKRISSENERRAREAGKVMVLETLVSVLDTFDMAMKMDPEKTPASAIMQGIEMIRSEMIRVLAQMGFTTIDPTTGDEFDPNRHEAVESVESTEVEPGAVVELKQPGYALQTRVIRPAKVTVSTACEEQTVPNHESGEDADGE